MQFMINKFNFKFATDSVKSEAYSPFAQHIDDIENKRSKLFPDRRRIPGRKIKYIVAVAFVIHYFALSRLIQAKRMTKLKNQQQVALQRKVVPLFQALNDQQYTVLKHRWDLFGKEVLGQDFVKKSYFNNKNITWIPVNRDYFGWTRSGLDRYYGDIWTAFGNRMNNGFQTQNI